MQKISFYLFFLVALTAQSQVRFARLFSDHVVLQRQKPIPVWGWAVPNEKISVSLANQTRQTQADASGKWQVIFAAMEANEVPTRLVASAKSAKVEIQDVLIGDVWLCSGQSNMEWKVKQANGFMTERKNADFSKIRHFFVEHEVSLLPETDLESGDWKVCSENTVGDFTAVGFFFAREIYQKTHVPIGLLHASWGGSQAESWISRESMLKTDFLKEYATHFPKTKEEADRALENRIKKKLLGNSTINPTVEDEKKYTEANCDFSKWRTSEPLGQWDWKGIWAFRGNGYMAKTIEIPDEMTASIATLSLPPHYGYSEIYLNGKQIAAGLEKGIRHYDIPAQTLKSGDNNLVIKMNRLLEPTWMGLGFDSKPESFYIENKEQKIDLAKGKWHFMPSFAEKHEYAFLSNNHGTIIHNAMITPLVPFALMGVLWYQGESNAERAYQYRQTFPLLINDWRAKWKEELPFYFVQLSSYGDYQNSNEGSAWAELREAQTMTLQLPKTGMAVTTDIGNPDDIHPTNKQDVGKRLALLALKNEYKHESQEENSSPMADSVQFENDKATVFFSHAKNGLVAKDKFGYLKGFEVASDDKIFYYARAKILDNEVVVQHPKEKKIASVRYAWADAPEDANLFNKEGLPACPFRTDDWETTTRNEKFE